MIYTAPNYEMTTAEVEDVITASVPYVANNCVVNPNQTGTFTTTNENGEEVQMQNVTQISGTFNSLTRN